MLGGENQVTAVKPQRITSKPLPLSTVSFQSWQTPFWFYTRLAKRWTFTLDAAADKQNTLCTNWYDGTEGCDGLIEPWDFVTYCNPPYKNIMPWVEKAITEAERGSTSVLLLPARLETKWFDMYSVLCETEIITPRLPFEGGNGTSPPHGSMLMIFSPETIATPTLYSEHRRIKVVTYRKDLL